VVHVCAAPLVALALLAARPLLGLGPPRGDAAPLVNPTSAFFLFWDLIAYALVVAVVHAIVRSQRLRERGARVAELQARLASAEIDVLTWRLQPTFLAAALEAIGDRAGTDPARADAITIRLGELLRHALQAERETAWPLERELAMLEAYLAIQELRSDDRLVVRLSIDPIAATTLVPAMILQPLAESVLEAPAEGGSATLDVTAGREGVVVTIDLTARSIPRATAAAPRSRDRPPDEAVGRARARLDALYGPDAWLALQMETTGVRRLRLTLPAGDVAAPSGVAARPALRTLDPGALA
jgi:LytS/YehU family sensor histidine kinase